jgi:hypothetical protein
VNRSGNLTRSLSVFFGTILVLDSIGCGNGMVDLQARVTLDGKPLDGASVTLYTVGAARNRPAVGTTNADGVVQHFMTFQPNDGVLPGNYKVVVIKTPKSKEEEFAHFDPKNPDDVQRLMARERSSNVNYTPSLLPRVYLDPEQTPLECKVPPDSKEVVFALDSSIGKSAK